MIPIIIKDLAENLRAWLLFSFAAAISTGLCSNQTMAQVAYGFTQALTFGGGVVFAHSVVFCERKRRHLVFLKSLPIRDSEIVKAKFISVLMLTHSLAWIPSLTGVLLGYQETRSSSFLSFLFITLYVSMVLGLYICFRNPALPFLPLYSAALILLWGQANLDYRLQLANETMAILSLIAAFVIYKSALIVFKRKELDF